MRIVALMRVRNEAWVLRYSARVVLKWCDDLVILDHVSLDATPQIIAELARDHPGRVKCLHDPDPEWREMAQLQRLLDVGRDLGGTHFALPDADEVPTANLLPKLRRVVEDLLAPGELLVSPLLNLWRSLDVYRRDSTKHGKQHASIAFRDAGTLGWPAEEQFHHRPPAGIERKQYWPPENEGGLLHLQRASWTRAQARQSHYKMVEVLRWPDKDRSRIDAMYQSSLEEGGARLHTVPPGWWAHGIDRSLIDVDAAPWEAAECDRMWAEHGKERFKRLRLQW